MIEDHVGMSCVWIACCMIEKISKDCKIELCGLLAHSTVHVYTEIKKNVYEHVPQLRLRSSTVKSYNCALALKSLVSLNTGKLHVLQCTRLLANTAQSSRHTRVATAYDLHAILATVPSVRYFTLYS